MKKNLFFLGIAALLVSCNGTGTEEETSANAIGFSGTYVGNSVATKGLVETTKESLRSFQVFGQYDNDGSAVRIFENVPVSSSDGSTWTYPGGNRVWLEGKNYAFAAYAPAEALASPEVNADGFLNVGSYTSDAARQYDLVYASQKASGQTSGNQPVHFSFQHLLSWVRISLTNGLSDEYEVKVSDVSVEGILPTNTFTPNNAVTTSGEFGGSWAVAEGVSSPFSFASVEETVGSMKANAYDMVVVPQTVGTVTVNFHVEIVEKAASDPIVSKDVTAALPTDICSEWNMGNRYSYKATIDYSNMGLEAIEFTVDEVGAWPNGGDSDLTLTDN